MKKRILSICLAIIMVLGMLPANVFAVGESNTEQACLHAETTVQYTQKPDTATHTITTTCKSCHLKLDTFVVTENCDDANADGKCDLCGGTVVPACAACADADNNKLCDVCKRSTNKLPKLIEGVEDRTVIIQTGHSYQLHDVTNGKIFEDEDDTLTYENYRYRKSSDGGVTWGEWIVFEELLFGGISDSVSNSVAGVYLYEFQAFDGTTYSESVWKLTLDTRDKVSANVNFYVGQDQNYSTNGNVLPTLKLYVTAGIDENYFDYVGWFTNAEGKKEYVYNPADYEIIDGEKDYVVIGGVQYELHDYEEVTFTNSKFDETATDATASGTEVDGYNMFFVTVTTGRYSTRAYGYNTETQKYDIYLGGQSMDLPREKDIYGNGGNDLYLRVVSVYSTSKKADDTYFTANDYYAEMIMPVTGSMIHSGDPYVKGNYTYFPFMSWAAGNGSLYNTYVYPYDTDNYIFTMYGNQTTAAGKTLVTKSMTISTAKVLSVTVPEAGEFGLYFQYNNFNTGLVEPTGAAVINGDGTKTIRYKVSGGGNYTWRLTDTTGTYVTKAGWLSNITKDTEKTITFSSFDNKYSHDFSNLGTTVDTRDEADIQVFLSSSGFLSTSEQTRIRAYRMWQLINSDTANIMLEPDFNVQLLQGNASDITLVNGNNSTNNWIDVLPTTTNIVAVNYNALDVYTAADDYGSHGGFFPATNPERTAVFIITNAPAGKAVAHIAFNGSKETDRGSEWDYNYDTWFYLNTDANPTLDFTVDGNNNLKVSYAYVTTGTDLKATLSDWTAVTADANGSYHADLLHFRNAGTQGGTVIIKMEDASGVSYALARVAEMSVTITNASNPGEPFMPGDDVTITFDGLYRSINKISGIFNPTTYYLRYSAGETEVNGTLPQYQQMDQASITLPIPENLTFADDSETTEFIFKNGYVFGGMYAASSPFQSMYYMTDTGVGTNFSAVNVSFVLSRLADVPVTVHKKVLYNVKLDVTDGKDPVTDYVATITDPDGNVVTPEADGTYKLGYGTFRYTLKKANYVGVSGFITLSSDSASDVVNGLLNQHILMPKAAANAWDGVTTTEPAQVDGVYQIGTGAELAWFAQSVNSGSTNIKAVLTADIDLAGYEWPTIGTNSKKFAGSFDGQNHKVYNLSANYAADSTSSPYKGLFGYTNGSASAKVEIKNLTVEGNIYLTSTKSVSNAYSAGVVGYANYTNLTNVHSKVNITVKRVAGTWSYVGGIAGYCGNGTITNCSNTGTINSWGAVGGIVGKVSASTITGCYNSGSITAQNSYAAGIAAEFQNASCTVSACYNTGLVTGNANYTGGVVGKATNGTIANCFNAGAVNGNGKVAGAVVGQAGNAAAVTKNLFYLEGTCAAGIGEVKDEEKQTATAVTANVLASAEFVTMMNQDLDADVFKLGRVHPVFLNQCAHLNTTITTTYDRIKGTETHTVTETCECGVLLSQTTVNCVDTDKNLKCDVCEGAVSCKHTNTTTLYDHVAGAEKHTVTVKCECGETIGEVNTVDCVDENKDLKCDVCNGAMAEENTAPPQTGDNTNLPLLFTVGSVSLVAMVALLVWKKKEYC